MAQLLKEMRLGFEASPYFLVKDLRKDGVARIAFIQAEGRFVSVYRADTWTECGRYSFEQESRPDLMFHVVACDADGDGVDEVMFDVDKGLYLIDEQGRLKNSRIFKERIVHFAPARVDGRTAIYACFEGGAFRLLRTDFSTIWETRFDGRYCDHSLYVGDIDGDGSDEALVALDDKRVFNVVTKEGRILWQRPVPEGDTHIDMAAFDDIDGDGPPEVVVAERGSCFDSSGNLRWEITPELGLVHGQEVHLARIRPDVPGTQAFIFDYWTDTPNCLLVDAKGKILWRKYFPRKICPCRYLHWRKGELAIFVCEQLPAPAPGPFRFWILDGFGKEIDTGEFDALPYQGARYRGCTACSNACGADINADGADELVMMTFDGRLYVFGR